MTFDRIRGVTVLFGGTTVAGDSAETWAWNGDAWNQLVVGAPSARHRHAMAFDSARGVAVLFGGETFGVGTNGETWEWNGVEWRHRPVGGPSPRLGHAMAYDAERGVTVLFGGYAGGFEQRDTWEWDGLNWSQRASDGPSRRMDHAIAFDTSRGVTVLFGGYGDSRNSGETWTWDGSSWALHAVPGPSPRSRATMAFDERRGMAVLFGGIPNGSVLSNETWEWNGETWIQRAIDGPGRRTGHAMVYDQIRAETVLFGGSLEPPVIMPSDTWALPPSCTAPILNLQPVDQAVGIDVPVVFFVEAVSAAGCVAPVPLSYQWQRRNLAVENPDAPGAWIDLTDGGGFVNTRTAALLISHPTPGLATGYRCRIGGGCACESGPNAYTLSEAVNFSVACPADFNADGGIDGADVQAFFDRWESGC